MELPPYMFYPISDILILHRLISFSVFWKEKVSCNIRSFFRRSSSNIRCYVSNDPIVGVCRNNNRNCNCNNRNWNEPNATDNSGAIPSLSSNYKPPQRFSQGTHVITYTAVDQSGNSVTCTFAIKVIGKQSCCLMVVPRRCLSWEMLTSFIGFHVEQLSTVRHWESIQEVHEGWAAAAIILEQSATFLVRLVIV